MNVSSYDQIIDSWSASLLLGECKSMENQSHHENYWLYLNDTPKNSVERYIQDCFDFYLAKDYPDTVGFEWWYHHFAEDDKMLGFHFDCDEHIRWETRKMILPSVSTVTYLNNHTSPTVITNVSQLGEEEYQFGPREPSEVVYSVPGEGKFITFDSRYLHGVTIGSAGRWTLMYNVWNYVPEKLGRVPYQSSSLSSHFFKCDKQQPEVYLGPKRGCQINYYDVECTVSYPSRTNAHETWLVNQ